MASSLEVRVWSRSYVASSTGDDADPDIAMDAPPRARDRARRQPGGRPGAILDATGLTPGATAGRGPIGGVSGVARRRRQARATSDAGGVGHVVDVHEVDRGARPVADRAIPGRS